MKEFYYACFKLALSIASKIEKTPEEYEFIEKLIIAKD